MKGRAAPASGGRRVPPPRAAVPVGRGAATRAPVGVDGVLVTTTGGAEGGAPALETSLPPVDVAAVTGAEE